MRPEITTAIDQGLVTLLPNLKTLLINKDSKNPALGGPFLESQNMQYHLFLVGIFLWRKYDAIYGHLKWEMEIWERRGGGI